MTDSLYLVASVFCLSHSRQSNKLQNSFILNYFNSYMPVLVLFNERAPKTATVDDQFVLSLRSNFKFTTSLSAVLSFGIILFTEKFSQDDQNVLLWCLTYCLRSGLSPPTSPACLVERVGSFFCVLVCTEIHFKTEAVWTAF